MTREFMVGLALCSHNTPITDLHVNALARLWFQITDQAFIQQQVYVTYILYTSHFNVGQQLLITLDFDWDFLDQET